MSNFQEKISFIWDLADLLRGVYKRNEYQKVILPFTVLKRFDCALSDSKKAVLETYKRYKGQFENMEPVLKDMAKDKNGNPLGFYNYSEYDFKALLEDPEHIEQNLMHYLDCFSSNVQDIFENFKIKERIRELAKADLLFRLTRNPIIASLLSRTIFVEKLGTGINRIRRAMKSSNLPAPEFKFYEHSFYTTLSDKTMIKGDVAEPQKTVEKTGQKIRNLSRKELLTLLENKVGSRLVEKVGSKLVENQLKIILLILEDEKITKNKMSEILNISDTAVDKNILKLKKPGYN